MPVGLAAAAAGVPRPSFFFSVFSIARRRTLYAPYRKACSPFTPPYTNWQARPPSATSADRHPVHCLRMHQYNTICTRQCGSWQHHKGVQHAVPIGTHTHARTTGGSLLGSAPLNLADLTALVFDGGRPVTYLTAARQFGMTVGVAQRYVAQWQYVPWSPGVESALVGMAPVHVRDRAVRLRALPRRLRRR